MFVQFNEAMYPNVQQWLVDNPKDQRLPAPIKQDLLRFATLTDSEKEQLQAALLVICDLPKVLQQLMPDYLSALPGELANMVAASLGPQDFDELTKISKRMHSLFKNEAFEVAHERKVFSKFLEYVAYGQQDKAERLLREVFHGQPARIEAALLHQGKLTDYSGRTFHCSAYEYAYWAKDTHMCRMLERYMNDQTKAIIAARIDEIECIDEATAQAIGLVYMQEGQEHRSAHFDFTPLKEAYQRYLDGHDAWYAANNLPATITAWDDVGKAQRKVPAHVAQEYCRPDRAFFPRPKFNEATLPRVFTLTYRETHGQLPWFFLTCSDPDFNFVVVRSGLTKFARTLDTYDMNSTVGLVPVQRDFEAIQYLDEVRTAERMLLREHLNLPMMPQSMNI